MEEEKLDQILRNQVAIMWAISSVSGILQVREAIRASEKMLDVWRPSSPINSHFKGEAR